MEGRREGTCQKNSAKIFFGQFLFKKIKFGHFSGKNHVKFGHVNFSYIFFGQKCRAPLKLTELLRLCCWLNDGKDILPTISIGLVLREFPKVYCWGLV